MGLLLSEDGFIETTLTVGRVADVVEQAGYGVGSFTFFSDLGSVPNHYIEDLCGAHHRSRLRDVGDGRLHVSCFTCWNSKPAGLLAGLLREVERGEDNT